MKKLLLLLALGIFSIPSCKKRDCEEFQFGTLIVTNYTDDPIKFYYDGVYLYDLESLVTETLELDVGTHIVGAKDLDSTHFSPFDWLDTIEVSACRKEIMDFEL